ncbi:MAG: universal stress protein [Capsulimonadaceae bacterium]|nr:universal stress protein [Capsulimonadaceae bacterium]
MIIDARGDVVTLSGKLEKNLWLSIQAAAELLLRQHPNGILIDASKITSCSPEGARTFLDGIEYIERHRARIVLCQVPELVMAVIRTVPGVRSAVPTAPTCEEARASLDLALRTRVNEKLRRAEGGVQPPAVLVPVVQGTMSVKDALGLAQVIGTEIGHDAHGGQIKVLPRIQLSYILVVPRSLPLNTPLTEEETEARSLLNEAEEFATTHDLNMSAGVARTRDAVEEIVGLARTLNAAKMVIAVPPASVGKNVTNVVENVLHKAPCEVLMIKKD